MARNRYELTYEENGKLYPIDLSRMEIITDGYLSKIIDYTTKFDNMTELLDELALAGLIPSKDVKIRYAIREVLKENGKKVGYGYRKIRYGNNIYFSNYVRCFDEKTIKAYFYENLKDSFFYNRVYIDLCYSFHLTDPICDLVRVGFKEENYKDFVVKVKNNITNKKISDLVRNLDPNHYPTHVQNIINNICKYIVLDPIVYISFAKKFCADIKVNDRSIGGMSVFTTLNQIYASAKNIGEAEKERKVVTPELQKEYDEMFEAFWKSYVMNKKDDINDRKLCNAGMFISHTEYAREVTGRTRLISTPPVERMESSLTSSEINSVTEQLYDYKGELSSKEEYITEDDFRIIGSTPEEHGFTKKLV